MSVLFIYINAWSATGGLQKFNRNFLTALESVGDQSDEKIYALSLHDSPADFPPQGRVVMDTAKGSRMVFIWKALTLGWKCRKIIAGHINILFPIIFLLPRPFVLITHGIEIWRPLAAYKKAALKRVAEIVTVSSFTQKRIEALFPFLTGHIELLPNTIDESFESRSLHADPDFIRKKYELHKEAKIILTVCRLSSGEGDKGYDKVLECIPELRNIFPRLHYILAGKYDTAEKNRLDILIEKYGIKDHVIFTGFLLDEDLPSVYASCDVFIMPSKKEGFGIVFLEALLTGKPVIGGNQDGTCDALLQGETGMLIDPDNVSEICGQLHSILSGNADQRFYDSDFLRKRSLESYGFKKYTERVRILLNK